MPAEDEDDYVEMGILGAIAFMEEHWSRIQSRPVLGVTPTKLVLTESPESDAELLAVFRAAFPLLQVSELSESDLKEGKAREEWTRFLELHGRGAEEMTMLRRDSSRSYDAEALLVPRLQFTCMEVAREAEGLGQEASVYALSERLGELRKELDGATKSSQEAEALRVLRQIGKLPVPSRQILVNSRCHLALKRATRLTGEKASSLAVGLLRRWKAALVMSSLASTTADTIAGWPKERVQDAAALALERIDRIQEEDDGQEEEEEVDDEGTEGDAKSDTTEPDDAPFTIAWSTNWEHVTELTEAMVEDGAILLETHGVAHLQRALSAEFTAQLCAIATANAAVLREKLVAMKGEEMADADVFRFAECSQRCAGRLDFRLGLDKPPFSSDELIHHPMWWPLIQRILGADAVLLTAGVVMAFPIDTPTPLGWHRDGPHLYDMHLPPHALNVMVPLCECDEELGPTEFSPGTHVHGAADDFESTVHFCEGGATMAAGSATLFDYRLLHRGKANHTRQQRPLLYLTYGKPWLSREMIESANFTDAKLLK